MPYLDETGESGICDFQAFWMSFCDWSLALWICVIAFNLHMVLLQNILTEEDARYES